MEGTNDTCRLGVNVLAQAVKMMKKPTTLSMILSFEVQDLFGWWKDGDNI